MRRSGLKSRRLHVGTQMTDFNDKLVMVYHFLTDRVPRDILFVDPRPRLANSRLINCQALVAKVIAGGEIGVSVDRAIALKILLTSQ